MYIRASTFLFPVYALASLAAAAPGDIEARAKCTSGTQLCCTQTFTADSTGVAAIKALLGYTVDPVVGPLLAVGCTGFVGSCTAQTVCCKGSQNARYKAANSAEVTRVVCSVVQARLLRAHGPTTLVVCLSWKNNMRHHRRRLALLNPPARYV
ncbi:hypothetical protein EDC04DRAFT_2607536 [Pisolithus marmoratus]|nr:hypothetical protein EDC04DRAFT_2607536 [Pisolithus marmoratus]